MPYDAHVIRDAIVRELGRGGQVFFVHNRVESIALPVRLVERLVPGRRSRWPTGRCAESALERSHARFVHGGTMCW